MPKNIALFSDGTGNSSAKAQKTNVWRLFQALDQTCLTQIAKYDDGVGTSSNKYLAALGGAFGWGLKRNVIDLYKFVCRNYVAGDRIYGFGFSRGAFTIRVLIGIIAREGLVTFRSEQELSRHAAAAYRSFRSKAFPSKSPIVRLGRRLRDFILLLVRLINGHRGYEQIADDTRVAGREHIPIRFLGLWDTVEAYGMPVVELKRAINWALWPMLFGDMKLSASVERAVHALSLDDERTTFHPLLWDEQWEAELAALRNVAPARVTQVWFAGVHSNVGGGYPEDQLSLVPLEWIMDEGAKCGLSVELIQAQEISASKSPFARLYDSRAGIAAYYRYSPRQAPIVAYSGRQILAKVHWSVLLRMGGGTDSYAPITLPHSFEVLLPNGTLVEVGTLLSAVLHRGLRTGNEDLDSALVALENPNDDEVGLVWDTVFWRTCLYALTVLLTVLAVAFPWLTGLLPERLDNVDTAIGGPVTVAVHAIGAMIPSYANSWKDALTGHPLELGLLAIAIALSLLGSRYLEGRIHDRSRLAWQRLSQHKISGYRTWRSESRAGFGRFMIVSIALFGFLALALLLWPGDPHRNNNLAWGFGATAVVLALGYALSILGFQTHTNAEATRARSTLALQAARIIRKNDALRWLYSKFHEVIVPGLFVVSMVAAAAVLLNRTAFDALDSAGVFCKETPSAHKDGQAPEEALGTSHTFHTGDLCFATGITLKKGQRYIVSISIGESDAGIQAPTDRWFDRDIPTDVTGFASGASAYRWLGKPLARSWGENWFKPIARIGRFGNDEYVLDPLADPDPLPKRPPACLNALKLPRWPIFKPVGSELATQINACSPVPPDRQVLRSEIKARRDGELFIYVNDGVLGIPGIASLFLENNSGTATIRVDPRFRRSTPPGGGQSAAR